MSLETLLEAARYVEQQEKKRARAAAAAAAAADHSHGVAPISNHHNSAEPRGAKLKRERLEQDDLFCEEKMLIIDEEEPLEKNIRPNGSFNNHHPTNQQQQQQQQQPTHHNHVVASLGVVRSGNNNSSSSNVTTLLVANNSTTAQVPQATTPTSTSTSLAHMAGGLALTQLQNQLELEVSATAKATGGQQHFVDTHNNSSNHSQGSSSGTPGNNGSAVGTLGNFVHVDVDNLLLDGKKSARNGPCVIRSGTREVHNKLEKNRRAHLKECFELLKKQLPSQDEKKSSNLSILHAAIRHIQVLKRKERDTEHELEKLAREKINAQQRLTALKKELTATWDHIDFNTLIPEPPLEPAPKNASENMDVDTPSNGLARGGTRYSSTSSLSSAATANSPQTTSLQAPSCGGNNNAASSQQMAATAAVVCQTQGLNLAQSSRESPPTSSSPGASTPSVPTPAQEKVTISPIVVQQTQQQQASHPQQQQTPTQIHLPIGAQMLNTTQGLATIMPTLQHLGSNLRVIPSDGRQLIAVQSNGGAGGNGETRPVALVVHSTSANSDNCVTFVHSTSGDRPLLAVQSSGNEVRPVTFVSGNEGRPLVLATTTHASGINVSNAQSRLRAAEGTQTTHKMLSGVTLVGSNGAELARLPGGAELNILPTNSVFRSVKAQPLTVQGGLTLSHAGVTIQASKPVSTTQAATIVQQHQQQQNNSNGGSQSTNQQHEGLPSCHIVASGHQPLAGLTPIVAPMTVVSQGNSQVILAPSSLAGKMIHTPLLKSGHLPLTVNAQYLNSLVKPQVVVVSGNHQPQQQSQQQQASATTNNNSAATSSQSAV